jgi:hypothetical protein
MYVFMLMLNLVTNKSTFRTSCTYYQMQIVIHYLCKKDLIFATCSGFDSGKNIKFNVKTWNKKVIATMSLQSFLC